MEFFEKAHVSRRNSSKKDSKSEEMVKKQLKQMLHGYKRSDNELIMSSGNAGDDVVEMHRSFDDSTSVSGFSDLNLTLSDVEDDVSQKSDFKCISEPVSTSSHANLSSLTELQTDSSENTDSQQSVSKLDPILEASTEDIEDSISEYNDDIVSLSQESLSEDTNTSADISLLEFEGSSTEIDDTDSEAFDPDGSLATKILAKLNESQLKTNKKGKKRKLDMKLKKKNSKNSLDDVPNNKNKKKSVSTSQTEVEIESLKISSDNEEISVQNDNFENHSVSTYESTPYISITASEMEEQSLREILGNYRHPTMRNLPCEKQNVVRSANTPLFETTSGNIINEDIDSLIPEFDDDIIVEDLEAELDNTEVEPIDESTEVYDNTIQSESSVERELSSEEELINSLQVYYLNNSCILVLKYPSQLYVHGKVKVKPLGGTVEVFGHILKDEVEIFAPNNSFAQCIKTVLCPNKYYGLFGKLTSSGLSVCEAEDIVTSISEYDCVLKMTPLVDDKMSFVENNVSTDLFTRPSKDVDESLKHASNILGCNLYSKKPWRHFEENESWLEAVKCGYNKYSRGIVCGGKGLGKSTFVRYYVNKLLDQGPVLVIDLDPGQAEFTVAGCISATVVTTPLLGPNFTHLKTPDICFNVGMINVMDNIMRFAKAITDLISYCLNNQAFIQMPWIINTMGMTTQMGLKFILLTILRAQPTFLVQIDTKIAKKRFECHLQRDTILQLYENFKQEYLFRNIELPEDLDYTFVLTSHVEGSNKHNTAQSPKIDRYFNFVSYFAKLLEINRNNNLLAIVPYEVNLSDLNVITNVKVPIESILKVLNGKIVALCQLGGGDKGKVFTLEDKAPLCHGHGLIRGVDFEKAVVYILSPVAVHKLGDIDTLVYSDWAPELQALDSSLPAGTPVPYRSAAHHTHKQLMLSPRRRFNPLQLLKMSRSA